MGNTPKIVQAGYRAGVLVDMHGNPIANEEEKNIAADKLREFMEKHRDRFSDFFKEYGPNMRPPIKYDLGRREWIWLE